MTAPGEPFGKGPNAVKPVIRTDRLGISFGTLQVLQDINLEVYEGEVVGVAGQSGAGKSALSSLLGGLSIPTEGSIYVNGTPVRPPFQARSLGIEFIHQRLVQARDAGKAVLLISADLEEILSLSDRIAVMYEGEIVGILDPEEATEERLGLMMTGGGK